MCTIYAPVPPATSGRSRLGRRGDDVDHRAHADAECTLVDVERGLVQIQLWALPTPHAESPHGAGHLFEVPGEVLATAGLMGVGQRLGADRLDRVGEDAGGHLFVD